MLKILANIFNKNRITIIVLALLTIISSLVSIISPYLSGELFDALSSQGDILLIRKYLIFIIMAGSLNIAIGYCYQLLSSKLIIKNIFDYRQELLHHLRKIPFLDYKKFEPTYLNERTRKDISEIVNFIVVNHINFFIKGMMLIVYIVSIAYLDRSLLICIIVIAPMYLLIYRKYSENLYQTSIETKEKENKFFNVYNEQLVMMEEIRVDSKFTNHDIYIKKNFFDYFRVFAKNISLVTRFNSIESVISVLFQAFLLCFGTHNILRGNMTIGGLMIINSYFSAIIGIINYYVSFGKEYQASRASYDRLQMIMSYEEEDDGNIKPENIFCISGDLNFAYEKEKKILINKRFCVNKGEVFGIIGKNGSGKTTMTKLLVGLYPISQSCKLAFNNIAIEKINMAFIREIKISYVMQNPKMTNKTVSELFEEIDGDVSYERIKESFADLTKEKGVEILYAIREYWNKSYYSLSEGERQFVAIVRALYKNPEILILDEPSSSLDAFRQKWLLSLIEEIKDNRIIILISHDTEFQNICDKCIYLS